MHHEPEPTPEPFDFDAYAARLAYEGPRRPTLETLAAVHEAHALAIPFENLDVFLGRTVRLDPASLRAKLIADRRGGWCFEHNLLLLDALESLGFAVTPLAARVRNRATRITPRTHMLLRVEADGATWLADVGFGAGGPLRPIPLRPGVTVRQGAWEFALERESSGRWLLKSIENGTWVDLYVFDEEPQHRIDYEVANHFVATHPSSPFVRTLTVQRTAPDVRHTLRGNALSTATRDGMMVETLTGDDAALLRLLRETFGLDLPDGTTLRAPIVSG